MTLFRCRTIGAYFWKRFSRLFPTMLLCSLLSFAMLHALPQGVFTPQWRDCLLSLTFTDPLLWAKVFGIPFKAVVGVYWSPFVEVKFYFGSASFISASDRSVFCAPSPGCSVRWCWDTWRCGRCICRIFGRSTSSSHSAPYPGSPSASAFMRCTPTRSCIAWGLLTEAVLALVTLQLGMHAGTVSLAIAIGLSYAIFLTFLLRPRWVTWLAYPRWLPSAWRVTAFICCTSPSAWPFWHSGYGAAARWR